MKNLPKIALFMLVVACLSISCSKDNAISPAKQLSLSEAIVGTWANTEQVITNCPNPNQNSNVTCPTASCDIWVFLAPNPTIAVYKIYNYNIDSTTYLYAGTYSIKNDSLFRGGAD